MIKLYQLVVFVRPLFGGMACRFYPSCSEYAALCFKANGYKTSFMSKMLALYFLTLRILRCNQLSKGGFDHPKIFINTALLKSTAILSPKQINIKYFLIPKSKNIFYIIKKIGPT